MLFVTENLRTFPVLAIVLPRCRRPLASSLQGGSGAAGEGGGGGGG